MGTFGNMLQQQAASTAGNIADSIIGIFAGKHQDRRQLRQTEKLQNIAISGQKEMSDYNLEKQMELWNRTNYAEQKKQIEKAGLNPALLYGMGGGGGATAAAAPGSVQTTQAERGREIQEFISMGIERRLAQAQTEVLKSQARLNNVEANKKEGPDTRNVEADTENKILQGVIQKYTGLEAKEFYENVSQPSRSIQAKTYQDEMEARQGIAGTVYELWKEGKLKDKSISEIEQIALNNAKTREEIRNIYKTGEILEENLKGAKIENVIKDLEMRLQKTTGIDRNSAGWLKILGRLFVELINK